MSSDEHVATATLAALPEGRRDLERLLQRIDHWNDSLGKQLGATIELLRNDIGFYGVRESRFLHSAPPDRKPTAILPDGVVKHIVSTPADKTAALEFSKELGFIVAMLVDGPSSESTISMLGKMTRNAGLPEVPRDDIIARDHRLLNGALAKLWDTATRLFRPTEELADRIRAKLEELDGHRARASESDRPRSPKSNESAIIHPMGTEPPQEFRSDRGEPCGPVSGTQPELGYTQRSKGDENVGERQLRTHLIRSARAKKVFLRKSGTALGIEAFFRTMIKKDEALTRLEEYRQQAKHAKDGTKRKQTEVNGSKRKSLPKKLPRTPR